MDPGVLSVAAIGFCATCAGVVVLTQSVPLTLQAATPSHRGLVRDELILIIGTDVAVSDGPTASSKARLVYMGSQPVNVGVRQ